MRHILQKECVFPFTFEVFIDDIQRRQKQDRQFGYLHRWVLELFFDLGDFPYQKIDDFLSSSRLRLGFECVGLP